MILLATLITMLAMMTVGLVLFRAFARWLSPESPLVVEGRDLLLIGPLPGLALVTILLTVLALFHLMRAWVMVPLALAILILLRGDARALWNSVHDAAGTTLAAARRHDYSPLVAILVGLIVTYIGLFLCFLPSSNVDSWVYHVPLVQSLADHAGFAYPQIEHLLYGTQPMALEMLAAAGSVFVDHFAIAGAAHLAIYLSLLLLLLSFARRARAFGFLLLCYLFMSRLVYPDATSTMIDTPRACISIAAYLFAYRYACDFRRLDLVLSALLAGFAVAAKTTELVTPLIICLTLVPLVWRRGAWRDFIPAMGVFTAISSYWYVKNLLLYGNPVYPFLFAHPGLSDAWMRDLMLDMKRPFDAADRIYSNDLLTLRGWRDFLTVLRQKFIWLLHPAQIVLAGLLLPMPRRWMLPFWSFLLFMFWYAMMFNHVRWAITAVMLLMAATFVVVARALDLVLDAWDGRSGGALARLMESLRRTSLGRRAAMGASLSLILFLVFVGVRLSQGRGNIFLPAWMDRNLLTALARSGDPEAYLETSQPGYEVYRYIGRHNLRQVLQPFDNGATLYVSAYNNGEPNRWILPYKDMPANLTQADSFLARRHVHYFVQPGKLHPSEIERLGPAHVALADRMAARLKTHSRLLLRDHFGTSLYEILPASRPETR